MATGSAAARTRCSWRATGCGCCSTSTRSSRRRRKCRPSCAGCCASAPGSPPTTRRSKPSSSTPGRNTPPPGAESPDSDETDWRPEGPGLAGAVRGGDRLFEDVHPLLEVRALDGERRLDADEPRDAVVDVIE